MIIRIKNITKLLIELRKLNFVYLDEINYKCYKEWIVNLSPSMGFSNWFMGGCWIGQILYDKKALNHYFFFEKNSKLSDEKAIEYLEAVLRGVK